jgi:hypothetical protein
MHRRDRRSPSRALLSGLFALAALTGAGLLPRDAAAIGVVLQWTAPGDDSTWGRAAEYDLRYSFRATQFPNRFSSALRVPTAVPASPGEIEQVVIPNLPESTSVYFALRTRDERGNWSAISNIVISQPSVSVDDAARTLAFSAPAPSPASHLTTFTLTLPRRERAVVEAIDITGRRVRLLREGSLEPGVHTLEWDLSDASGRAVRAGVFFIRARVAGEEFLRRVVVLR